MSLNLPSRDRLFHPGTLRYSPVAVALMALLLIGCQQVETPITTGTEDPASVASSEGIDSTEQLIGSVMTIRAEPVTKVSPHTFTVQDEGVFGTEPILAINASGGPVIVPTDTQTPLQITGTVVWFIATDIEQAYGLELDPNLYAEYEGRPAIIAQSIAFSPEPAEITTNPTRYYNHVLAVPGEVTTIVTPNSFTLDASGAIGSQRLLAIVPNPQSIMQTGQTVMATGVLRPFVLAEIEREHNLTWDLKVREQLEVEYKDQAVLIVDQIYSPAIAPFSSTYSDDG